MISRQKDKKDKKDKKKKEKKDKKKVQNCDARTVLLSSDISPSSDDWFNLMPRNGGREFGNYSCVATNLMGSARSVST